MLETSDSTQNYVHTCICQSLFAFVYTSFFTLLISHINHIKYSKHFCCRKKKKGKKQSVPMTCNHVCITFQHKTYSNNINTNSNDIIWTMKWKSLFSIFSWWNNSTLHNFPVISLCTRNIQNCILPVEISF